MALPEQPNPFLTDIQVHEKIKVLVKENNYALTVNDGSTMNLTSNIDFEADSKTNLYTDSKRKGVLTKLSPRASKIFIFVLLNLEKNQDYINFTAKQVGNFTGYSENTFYKYLDELFVQEILRRRHRDCYWINPRVLFKGDRLAYFKTVEDKFKTIKVLDEPVNLSEIEKGRRVKKKNELMKYFNFTSYYDLKVKLGDEQIQQLMDGKLRLQDVKLLK